MPRRNKRNNDFDFTGDYNKLSQLQKELVRNHAKQKRRSMMDTAMQWDEQYTKQKASEGMRGHEA